MAFLRTHYVTSDIVIAAAGNLSHRQVVAAISRCAARFPQGGRPQYASVKRAQRQPALRLFTKDTEQTQLALGVGTCSRHDERRFALRLLNTVLGENMSSRLFQVVREDRGLAYSIYSVLSFFDDAGALNVSAGLDAGNVPRVLKLIVHELRRLRDGLLTVAELRRARDYVIGQLDLSLEGTENQMMWLGEQYLGYGKISPATAIKHRLSAVKASDIRAVARDFFRPERMNLALVSPVKSANGLKRILAT
jgi:predicted Zn-dependent peptidase